MADIEVVQPNFDESVAEMRLLTVDPAQRGKGLPFLLIYAAYRLCRSLGARRVVITGHGSLVRAYRTLGMASTNLTAPAGALVFELLVGDAETLDGNVLHYLPLFRRLLVANAADWRLPFAFEP